MNSIIFMGTPDFSVTVLAGLVAANYQIKAVVTQPDKKVGRKQIATATPVKKYAQAHGLKVFQPTKLSGSPELAELIAMQSDFIVTAAYGQFLPTKFLESAKVAAVNVHGSLLPKYRGGAPIQYAIMNGDRQTGITIMEMVKKMDAGDMYAQQAIDILPTDTAGTIFAKLAVVGRDLLLKTLPKIATKQIQKTPQIADQVTFAYNIKPEEEQITTDFTAVQAVNLIHALNPDPGAYLLIDGFRLKVWDAKVVDSAAFGQTQSGQLLQKKKHFVLAMANQSALELLQVQPTGKASMSGAAFMNGKGQHLQLGDRIVTNE